MSKMLTTIILVLFVVAVQGFPSQDYRYFHPGTVMLGGYYGMPPMRYPNYYPEESDPIPAASEDFEKEALTEVYQTGEEEFKEQSTEPQQISNGYPRTQAPKKPIATKPRRKNEPEDDESPASNFPFGASGGSSFLNNFFPIMVGGSSRGRGKSGQDDGLEGPGGATAIANSFSTGRGGVASSHATSFGDVFMGSALSDMLKKAKRI